MDPRRTILSCIDLTSLEGSDNAESISRLCRKAISFGEKGLPCPSAVCVFPVFVNQAQKILSGTGIRVASVAGAFPSGQSPLYLRIEEVKYAAGEGADEIDVVISRGKILEGDFAYVTEEISRFREAAKGLVMKAILGTGELRTSELIRGAAKAAIEGGADFIKSSTGKIPAGATPEGVTVMLEVICNHFRKTGRKIGIKPAGGIYTVSQALEYLDLVRNIAGEPWLSKDLFRIGASRLADNLASEILGNPTV